MAEPETSSPIVMGSRIPGAGPRTSGPARRTCCDGFPAPANHPGMSATPTPMLPRLRPRPADAADFEARVEAHRGILRKVAASYARDADDRADLMQDMALQLWRAWPSYEPVRPFSTWMYRIALNVAISHRRREHRRPAPDPLDERHDELAGADDVDAET